jgi:AraC-like DNA-binding protein
MSHDGLSAESSIERSNGASSARFSPLIERARRFIRENLHERPLGARRIAAAIGSTPRRLNLTFAEETGETIKAHVLRTRLELAMESIRAGIKIGAVALGVGYQSRSNFIRHFRAAYGSTPSTFAPGSDERRTITMPTFGNGRMKAPQVEIIIRARQPVVEAAGKLADVDIVFGPASALHGLTIDGFEVMLPADGKALSINFPRGHSPDANEGSSGLRMLSAAACEPLCAAIVEVAQALGRDPKLECAYEKLAGHTKLHRLVFN